MVKRIMMKHDKAKHEMKREAMKKDEDRMNTMNKEEDEEDSMNQLGEDEKRRHEDEMNNRFDYLEDDEDMNRELGEGMDNDRENRRESRKLGDSQGSSAAVEAEAKEVEAGKEPFSSEPVTDEDGDEHFVMTDKARRAELKEAAYGKSESSEEQREARVADETEREKHAISIYQAMDEKKRIADKKRERMHRYVQRKLAKHNLMRDSKGRVVPNV